VISAADRAFVAALCLNRAGLKVDPDKPYLIESRLAPVARREGYSSSHEFVTALRDRADDRQCWAAVEAMALAESEFFRDRPVFEALVQDVLPALAHARAGGVVRVWSAACGSGQEIYSLAMLLADGPPLPARVELFASDLSERSLEKAQAGLYSQFEAQSGLPARALVRHFEKRGEAFALSPRIRQMVRWRRVNLLDDLSRVGQFELILCRNAVGQLAPEIQGRVTASLARALTADGRLVVGLGEAVGPDLQPIAPHLGIYAAAPQAARSAA
jgi:chemotaxis protein methyltransferase CheR